MRYPREGKGERKDLRPEIWALQHWKSGDEETEERSVSQAK